jgi:hypothetical protein
MPGCPPWMSIGRLRERSDSTQMVEEKRLATAPMTFKTR